MLPKILESKALIRFPDCDPFNHLNNARYIDYMINAREDHILQHYGLNIYKMAKETGVSWVVSQTQIAYISSAYLMETVVIETKLIDYSDKIITVEAKMFTEDKTRLKALMWINFAHFNFATKKSQQHSEDLMKLFSTVKVDVYEPSFEARLEKIKSSSL